MIDWILEGLADILITVINYVIAGVGTVLGWIAALFPSTPFDNPYTPPEVVNLSFIAWFIPYTEMVIHATVLASAILTYYGIRVLARWIRMVKN